MISIDTNILLPAVETGHRDHPRAVAYLGSLNDREDVAVSEFILLELYGLLRNAAVLANPLNAPEAVDVCLTFRRHPRWQVIGFPAESQAFHNLLWPKLREKTFARRRAYDLRVALSLLRQGVTQFATVNVKDFKGLGFARVWNPLST